MKVIPLHFVYPQAWRDAGLPISTNSNECAKLYDAAVSQVLSVRLEQKSRVIFNSSKSITGKRQEMSCLFPIYHTLFFLHPTILHLFKSVHPLEVLFHFADVLILADVWLDK